MSDHTTGPGSGVLSSEDFYENRARSLMEVGDPSDFGFFFDDFEKGSSLWTRVTDTSGILDSYSLYHGGWYEVQTSATAGREPKLVLGDNSGGTDPSFFPEDTGGVFYLGIRCGFPTAISTAQTAGGFAMRRSTAGTIVGRLGKIAGQANWAFQGDSGSLLNSGVLADDNIRVLEAVRVGGVTYLYVDGVLRAQGDTFPTELSLPAVFAANGTDAVNRRLVVDWVAAGFKVRKTGTVI